MHVVIMGCGRVGSSLALALEARGHEVAVIDRDPDAFRRLDPSFDGLRVTGTGFDRDVLRAARIEDARAFAAVSSGDNSNILAARVARETFGVQHVVARIYDPGRAAVYERLGIPTVATVRWTTGQVLRRLLPEGALPVHADPSGRVVVVEVPVHPGWVGRRLTELTSAAAARVAYVTRLGEGLLPGPDHVHQEGDLVHLITTSERADEAAAALGREPGPGARGQG